MEFKETTIIKLSFAIFILSFILLYHLDQNYSPNKIPLKIIDKSYFGKFVKVDVKIEKQSLNNNTLFLVLSDLNDSKSKIPAIIFNTNKTFDKKKIYEMIGKVDLYKNKVELLIEKIQKVKS